MGRHDEENGNNQELMSDRNNAGDSRLSNSEVTWGPPYMIEGEDGVMILPEFASR